MLFSAKKKQSPKIHPTFSHEFTTFFLRGKKKSHFSSQKLLNYRGGGANNRLKIQPFFLTIQLFVVVVISLHSSITNEFEFALSMPSVPHLPCLPPDPLYQRAVPVRPRTRWRGSTCLQTWTPWPTRTPSAIATPSNNFTMLS